MRRITEDPKQRAHNKTATGHNAEGNAAEGEGEGGESSGAFGRRSATSAAALGFASAEA